MIRPLQNHIHVRYCAFELLKMTTVPCYHFCRIVMLGSHVYTSGGNPSPKGWQVQRAHSLEARSTRKLKSKEGFGLLQTCRNTCGTRSGKVATIFETMPLILFWVWGPMDSTIGTISGGLPCGGGTFARFTRGQVWELCLVVGCSSNAAPSEGSPLYSKPKG